MQQVKQHKKGRLKLLAVSLLMGLAACSQQQSLPEIENKRLVEDLRILSADEMGGRAVGTEGNKKARNYILSRMQEVGLEPYRGAYQHSFRHQSEKKPKLKPIAGVNLAGAIRGTKRGRQTLYVTAHYDHVGIRGGEIYNGADDNASGVAAVLAMAEAMKVHAPDNDIVFVFFDAEENGLVGARKFVPANMDEWGCTAFNVNLDMVSRNDKGELYMAGGYHSETLKTLLGGYENRTAITLKQGHDRPEDGQGDWTLQSDHAAFHRSGVPFLYFGVEDHPHYHKPSDVFETVPLDFFGQSATEITSVVYYLDQNLRSVGRSCDNPKWTDARPK